MTNFWEIFRILLKIFNDTESKKEDGNMKDTQTHDKTDLSKNQKVG